jgi:hypothetical protein
MGRTYYGKNGEIESVNFSMAGLHDQLVFCIFSNKIGIRQDLNDKECKLIAKIFRNFISIQEKIKESPEQIYLIKMGYDILDKHSLWVLEQNAIFFDSCNGMLSEDEYFKKFPEND